MTNEQARDAAFEKIFNEPFDDSHEAMCFTLGFDAGWNARRGQWVAFDGRGPDENIHGKGPFPTKWSDGSLTLETFHWLGEPNFDELWPVAFYVLPPYTEAK